MIINLNLNQVGFESITCDFQSSRIDSESAHFDSDIHQLISRDVWHLRLI